MGWHESLSEFGGMRMVVASKHFQTEYPFVELSSLAPHLSLLLLMS